MKNHLFWMLFVLAGLIIIGGPTASASAHLYLGAHQIERSASIQQADQTPIPTVSPSLAAIDTPESREMPPVGSNAGLVIGASVLVLIIIGGVLGTRRREKH
jgi:hypothetical protein